MPCQDAKRDQRAFTDVFFCSADVPERQRLHLLRQLLLSPTNAPLSSKQMAHRVPSAARPTTRVPRPPADLKQADPDTHITVHLLVFEYILHNATVDLLAEAGNRPWSSTQDHSYAEQRARSDTHISMIESFLNLFKLHHPGVRPPQELSFRLRLVRFVILYARRVLIHFNQGHADAEPAQVDSADPAGISVISSASLQQLRRRNRHRAQRWLTLRGYNSQPNQLERFTAKTDELGPLDLERLGNDVTLTDLIPSFVKLTSARASLQEEWVTNEKWLQLAAEFMLQATSEQAVLSEVTTGEANVGDAMSECFAWGPFPELYDDSMAIDDDDDDDDAHDIHEIFYTKPPSDTPGTLDPASSASRLTAAPWRTLRATAIDALRPALPSKKRTHDGAPASTTAGQIRALLRRPAHEPRAFDAQVREFLHGLADSLDRPLLTQLEDAAHVGGDYEITLDGEPVSARQARRLLRIFQDAL